jgi:ABC-type multidrug transport system fused ATPase/permease subunit
MLQITDAAKRARTQGFVMELPSGFSTQIGDHGLSLATCDAFRIGLARALLRDPSILIIEEPEDELDEASSVRMNEALRLAGAERTMILLPARLSTLRSMDRVVVLHEGQVHAEGTHAELLQKSELYRHLNYVRFHAFRRIR